MQVWVTVDIDGSPELMRKIQSGSLHVSSCPGCGASIEVDAPLLVYRRGQPPALIFSPAQGTSMEENQEHARQLMGVLPHEVGLEASDTQTVWPGIPRQLVPVAVAEGGKAVWESLMTVVQQFIETTTWEQAYWLLREHPEMVHDTTVAVLAWWRDHEREREAERPAQVFEERRRFVSRCREIGVDAAFVEKMGVTMDQLRLFAEVQDSITMALQAEDRYGETGHVSALDRAVACWEHVIARFESTSVMARVRHPFLNHAGQAFLRRYLARGETSDLERALTIWRQAVAATPSDSPDYPEYLTSLGKGLLAQYRRTGHQGDLEQAIHLARNAVLATPEDSPERDLRLINLGHGLLESYQQTGRMEALEQALDAFHRAVLATPEDSTTRVVVLSNLSGGLYKRYRRTGHMDDLQRSIDIARQAVRATPEGSPSRSTLLNNLGNGLSTRYSRTGSLEDLQEAIDAFRQAVLATPEGSPERAVRLYNFGIGLKKRYERTGDLDDLQRAIDSYRVALAAVPEGSPERPSILSSLASGLRDRCTHTDSLDDLQEAIDVAHQAALATPEDSPEWLQRLNNIGSTLYTRYLRTRSLDDLHYAIAAYRRALMTEPEGSPARPGTLDNLGDCLLARYRETAAPGDLEDARNAFAEAMRSGRDVNSYAALTSARSWGNWALERGAWQEALRAYEQGFEAAEELYRAQVFRSGKESWLRELWGLHARAAYCHARMGDLRSAVLALEAGRARLLTEVLERDRADLERARVQAPGACARYERACQELQRLRAAEHARAYDQTGRGDLRLRLGEALDELEAALSEIRSLDGHERFLSPPVFEELVRRLEAGVPVVCVAATPAGGLALAVCRGPAGVSITHRWLDPFTEEVLFELTGGVRGAPEGWLGAYSSWREDRGNRVLQEAWHAAIEQTTRRLWDLVMGPILDLLQPLYPQTDHGPSVRQAVLIPEGTLAVLPLHAAWTDEPTRRWAMDEVAFRYAPSLRALVHAHGIVQRCASRALLAVDEPGPLEGAPLPNSAHEVAAAVAVFEDHQIVRHAECRRQDVLAGIARADVCHFSCHGLNQWHYPLESGLVMAGPEMLSVRDLLGLPSLHARLAVLSACETGMLGGKLPNEVISLPAAFLQAGFAGVVASMWSVFDIGTSLLMARFYELWRKDLLAPAIALQRAQIWLRELTNDALVTHLEGLVPDLVPKMPFEEAAALHFRALVQDPEGRPFAHPVHWAAFYFTGV